MKIHLKYCSMWNYEPKAVSLATLILTSLKQKISGFELEPSGGGCFELTVDGKLVYSKLATDEFPDEATLLAEVEGMAVK